MRSRTLVNLAYFVKSTVIGGVFVLVPLVAISIALGHAVRVAYGFVHPLMQWLPVQSVSTVSLAFLAGITVVVLICFIAGLVARAAVLQWLVGSLEQVLLAFVPGYSLMKSMGQGWIGVEADQPHPPVSVRLDDATHLGFAMDTLPDSRRLVFLPDSPNPWSGTLLIVAADRVEALPLSTKQAIECLRKLGANSGRMLAKA